MSDNAEATAAPAPAPNATDTAPTQAPADSDVDEAPPDPDAELEKHVQHALKVGKKLDAKRAREEKKADPKAKKPAAPAANAEPAKEPAASVEASPTPAPPGDLPSSGALARARKMLDEGNLDGAFELAFGKKPQDFQVNAKAFAALRHERSKAMRDVKQYDDKVSAIADGLAAKYGHMVEAQELYDKGDLAGALEKAFKTNSLEFNRKLVQKHQERNPEVEALKAKLQAFEDAQKRDREEAEQRQHEQAANAQRVEFMNGIRSTLAESADAQLAALSARPAFVRQVFKVMADHYDPHSRITLPIEEAADMVRNDIVDEFGDVIPLPRNASAQSAASVQGSSNPARQGAKALNTLSQNGAVEASAPRTGWHGVVDLDTQIAQFLGKPNGARTG